MKAQEQSSLEQNIQNKPTHSRLKRAANKPADKQQGSPRCLHVDDSENAINKMARKQTLKAQHDLNKLVGQAQCGNKKAQSELARYFSGFTRAKANRYKENMTGREFQDLFQEGQIGLLLAVRSFDLKSGNPFFNYACVCIKNAMTNFIKKAGWFIRLPKGLTEEMMKLREKENALSIKFGRTPTQRELAEALDCSDTKLRALQEHSRQVNITSLSGSEDNEDSDSKDNAIKSFPGPKYLEPDYQITQQAVSKSVHNAMKTLSPRNRMIFMQRVLGNDGAEMSYADVAKSAGEHVSSERVRQICLESQQRLRPLLSDFYAHSENKSSLPDAAKKHNICRKAKARSADLHDAAEPDGAELAPGSSSMSTSQSEECSMSKKRARQKKKISKPACARKTKSRTHSETPIGVPQS